MSNEIRTPAGRALLADAAIPAWWSVTPEDDPVGELSQRILAIEREAAAAALERVRAALEGPGGLAYRADRGWSKRALIAEFRAILAAAGASDE
jgi:hypothetical protein